MVNERLRTVPDRVDGGLLPSRSRGSGWTGPAEPRYWDPMSIDHDMMRNALRCARRGLGVTAPNPSVGAVIAHEATGEVIARGWTQPGGRPHAETEAIRRAGQRARGATMYVTLEPCAHYGRTPPCADAIVAAGLRRVVVGTGDPDPRTAGQGIARLRAAGIDVTTAVCEGEARWLALGHILRQTEGRPFVQVKLAVDRHGDVARGAGGRPVWVTGPEARARGHLLRAKADAILVGAGTIRDDDPDLTCRLPGLAARSPVRIVIGASLDPSSRLVTTARNTPVWFCTTCDADSGQKQRLEAEGVLVIEAPGTKGRLDIGDVLGRIAGRGITRLLVEGGPSVWKGFAAADLVDEAVVFQAGAGLPANDAAQDLAVAVERWLPGAALEMVDRRTVGGDCCYDMRRK